jgi:hypothetical protein
MEMGNGVVLSVVRHPASGHFAIRQTSEPSTTHRTFWHICKPTNLDTKPTCKRAKISATGFNRLKKNVVGIVVVAIQLILYHSFT